jgi:hypothetical protein
MPDPIFANLAVADYQVTSKATEEYNCISWSVHVEDQVIWPDEDEQFSWPVNLPRSESVEVFTEFFVAAGYELCDDGELDAAYEKVALYVDDGLVVHAARQLPNGRWTSKLGAECDICHNMLGGLEGPVYGQVSVYLRRMQSGVKPTLPPLHPGPARLITLTGGRLL